MSGDILYLSSSCISILGLDYKKLTKLKTHIQDIVFNFDDKLKALTSKQGAVTKCTDIKKKLSEFYGQVNATPIAFSTKGQQGYIVRLERQAKLQKKKAAAPGALKHGANLRDGHANAEEDSPQKSPQPARKLKAGEAKLRHQLQIVYDFAARAFSGQVYETDVGNLSESNNVSFMMNGPGLNVTHQELNLSRLEESGLLGKNGTQLDESRVRGEEALTRGNNNLLSSVA